MIGQLIEHKRFFIGGEWRAPAGSETLDVISPSSEELVGRVPLGTAADIAAAVAAARKAFDEGPWPRMSFEERREIVMRTAEILEPQADELSDLLTSENGMLRRNGFGNVKPNFDYYCSLSMPAPFERSSFIPNAAMPKGFTGSAAEIVYDPVGVVGAIVPWNGPLFVALQKLLPALLGGCTAVLKPAPETPLNAYPLAQAFADAGLPPGVLNVVVADRDVSQELVSNRDVDLVSFTGSTAAGRKIGAICGEQIKRAVLELGGKSAAIVLEDADLTTTIPSMLVGGMLGNNGESCAAWTRMVIPESRRDEIVEAICDYVSDYRMGDPFDADTDIGPLIAERQRDRVEGYIKIAQDEGARVAIGGGRPSALKRGWFVEPTVLVDATNDMRSSREEIFGPVGSVITYSDLEEGIRIVNDSNYGLSSAVFSGDLERARDVAQHLRTGTVCLNTISYDDAFPFGGYKDSGIGRQNGPEGIVEYLEMKTIGRP